MKVTQKQAEDLTLMVSLTIGNDDYAPKIKKILGDYRRNADIKGFRKGMAPMSMIEKMHGQSAMVDAVNNLISEGLNNFINDNKLNIIGEPLANETEQKPVSWKAGEDMEFIFDIALAPKVDIALSADDKIVYYEADISKGKISMDA